MDAAPDQSDLLTQTRDRARHLWERLERQAAELAATTEPASLTPAQRERGLQVVRAAASAAERLYREAEDALHRRHGNPPT